MIMGRADLVVQDIGGVTVVELNDATILNAPVIENLAHSLYELVDSRGRRNIVLDFSNVKTISSSLLSVLVTLERKVRAIKGRMVISGLREELLKPFKITQLDKMFVFYEDQSAALGSFGVRITEQ